MRTSVGAIILICFCFLSDNLSATYRPLTIYYGNVQKLPFEVDAAPNHSSTFALAVFGRLLIVDADFSLKPGLLERFYFDSKLNGYVLELGGEVAFHNQRKATTADLEFSLLRGFYSKTQNFFAVYFDNIEGVNEIKPGSKFKSGAVRGVRILDKQRLLVTLKTPNPSFLYSLGNLLLGLVPREELETDYFTWRNQPVGAGPYKILNVDRKKFVVEIQKVSNVNQRVRFVFSPTTELIDLSIEEIPGFSKSFFTRPGSVYALFFSSNNLAARDRNLRLSIASRINRSILTNDEFKPAEQLLPPTFWGREQKALPFVAIPNPPHLDLISASVLSLSKTTLPHTERMVTMIKETISALGAKPSIQLLNKKFWSKAESEASIFLSMGFLTNYFDPLITFKGMGPGSPLQGLQWPGDAVLAKLFREAQEANGYTSRFETIRALSNYVIHEAYVIPIAYRYSSVFSNPDTTDSPGPLDYPDVLFLDQIKRRR